MVSNCKNTENDEEIIEDLKEELEKTKIENMRIKQENDEIKKELSLYVPSDRIDCSKLDSSPKIISEKIKQDITGSANAIFKSVKIEGAVSNEKVKEEIKNLYQNYPGSDKIAINSMLINVMCESINNSKDLNSHERFEKIFTFASIVNGMKDNYPNKDTKSGKLQIDKKQIEKRIFDDINGDNGVICLQLLGLGKCTNVNIVKISDGDNRYAGSVSFEHGTKRNIYVIADDTNHHWNFENSDYADMYSSIFMQILKGKINLSDIKADDSLWCGKILNSLIGRYLKVK